MTAPLACTVRGCGRPLVRHGRQYLCDRRHAYDVARSGYVNLLQPQDRRSAEPGDARAAVEARVALEAAGVGRSLIEAVAQRTGAMDLPPGAVVVDLGCGTGAALGSLAAFAAIAGIGIDLSTAAVAHAARHWPGPTWVVANADRTLPLLDGSVDLVTSLHARRNPVEVARVLRPGGVLVVAVPAPDDLAELREVMQGTAVLRDRVPGLVAEHTPLFTLDEQRRVTDRRRLGPEALAALLAATYRSGRHSVMPIVERLSAIEVTLASDICVFRPHRAEAR